MWWCDIMISDRMQIMNEPFLRIFKFLYNRHFNKCWDISRWYGERLFANVYGEKIESNCVANVYEEKVDFFSLANLYKN